MATEVPADTTAQLTADALLAHSPPQTTKKPHPAPSATSDDDHSLSATHTNKKAKLDNLSLPIDLANPIPTPSSTLDGGPKEAVVNPGSGGGRASHPRRGVKDDFGGDGKEFLSQGLYWSPGMSRPSVVITKTGSSAREDKAARKDDEVGWKDAANSAVLPLPLYHGETLLEEERAFKLPFDLAPEWVDDIREVSVEVEEGEKEAMAREKSRKPEPYGHLSRNIYVDRKPDKAENLAICACVPPKGDEEACGESCINRMMQYSCDPKTCPAGDRCTNKPLGLQEGIPEGKNGLRVIWTGNRGFGLKTMVPIKAGQYVTQYLGEIITRDESYRRVLTTYKDSKSYYFLDYDGHEVIDAGQRGNFSRFINHSCGPNVTVVSWRFANVDEYQMGIFAINDIEAGTELTYDYGWQDFSSLQAPTIDSLDHRQACFCGAPPCTGWLGGKKDKPLSDSPVGGSGKYRATGKAAAGKSFGGVPGSRFGAGRKVVVVPALRKAGGGKKGSESEGDEPKGPTMEASCKKCRERKVKCPRNLGSCSRCTRRGDVCVYDDEVRPVEPKPRAERKLAAANEEMLMETSCKRCRERRVKCPRNKGTCDRCAKRRDHCEYDNEPRKLEEMEVDEDE